MVDTMVQQYGSFTEQEGAGAQEFDSGSGKLCFIKKSLQYASCVIDNKLAAIETSTTTSATEEEAAPFQPSTSSGTKRKADRPRTKEKRRKEGEGWSEFIDAYKEECAKDRKSREMMVQSMNDALSRAINVLVSNQEPAIVL
nr:uncharacterized protein LOC113475408 isoform X2 [Ciona intestinalis]|eukprot:XP_026695335.1 uncharacterized protein LOC113475408 isoform X2 [Ciona intestinalis]